VDNGDGTLSDAANGLMWEKDGMAGPLDASTVRQHCGVTGYPDVTIHGKTGWRVPTVDEVRTLVVGCPASAIGGACVSPPAASSAQCTGCGAKDSAATCYMAPNGFVLPCDPAWAGLVGVEVDFSSGSIIQHIDTGTRGGTMHCVRALP
jgi:hypothetical protein